MEALILAGFFITGAFSLKHFIEFINGSRTFLDLHIERQDAE